MREGGREGRDVKTGSGLGSKSEEGSEEGRAKGEGEGDLKTHRRVPVPESRVGGCVGIFGSENRPESVNIVRHCRDAACVSNVRKMILRKQRSVEREGNYAKKTKVQSPE